MNYLGHAYLSFGNAGVLTGNMMGDHVKGRQALERYPDEVRKGLELHRKIDDFVDKHPGVLRAKLLFREAYGLYAGAITDTIFDHFLANDPKIFATPQHLLQFTTDTYVLLEQHAEWHTEEFVRYFPYMKEQNWLYNYRTMKGIEKSLQGLHRRAQHMPPPDSAYASFVAGYYQLNQCYYELIDDIVSFVRTHS